MRVAVVGGGITGLAAALRLASAGVDVTVLEAGGRLGGKLASTEIAGVSLDVGAESVLARRPEATRLIAELGLGDDQVHPGAAKPAVLHRGAAHALPPSILGVPSGVDGLRPLLSAAEYRVAADEPRRPAPPLEGDLPIGTYVDRRFGTAVTNRVLEPMLGGIYAGQSRELSFEAVAPQLFERARRGGSLFGHAAALSGLTAGSGPVFAGLRGGVATLVPVLVDALRSRGATLRTGVTVRGLEQRPGGFRLNCGADTLDVDAVVLAAPAPPAGRLLAGVIEPGVAAEFAATPYASVAVVTLLVRGLEPTSSGLLVPPGELPTVKALTYSSVKWPWVAELAEAAWGSGVSVVRASVGRSGEAQLLQLDDDALLRRTFSEAQTLREWAGAELVRGQVTRWGGGLPQYLTGHRARVDRLRAEIDHHPGLAVAGAALDGVGIAACLASAEAAAAVVAAGLGGSHRDMIEHTPPAEERPR